MRRRYYLLPAEREEVRQAVNLYLLARSDALEAKNDLLQYGATGMVFVQGMGHGLTFGSEKAAVSVAGLRRAFLSDALQSWVALPDMRTAKGRVIQETLLTVADLVEIWRWSLERALGVYGLVMSGFPQAFHYCVAKPLSDGRIIISTPAEKNRPDVSRNFEEPVIPDWAIEISEKEYQGLYALPILGDQENSLPAS